MAQIPGVVDRLEHLPRLVYQGNINDNRLHVHRKAEYSPMAVPYDCCREGSTLMCECDDATFRDFANRHINIIDVLTWGLLSYRCLEHCALRCVDKILRTNIMLATTIKCR